MKQEQLEHLYEIGNEETKKYLESELNYKRPFKVGDFVKDVGGSLHIGLITSLTKGTYNYCGIDCTGRYVEDGFYSKDSLKYFSGHPTKEEIEQYTIKVAELKGYKEGVTIENLYDKTERFILTGRFEYDEKHGLFAYYNAVKSIMIWRKWDNKWAEIIDPKKWTYTQVVTEGHWIVTNGHDEYTFGNDAKAAKDICEYLNSKEKG